MIIPLKMQESDIIRAIKNPKYSPIQILASRIFKENLCNVDAGYDSIVIWNDEINDYHSFIYCTEDIDKIKAFIDDWNDYKDDIIPDFDNEPISFCVQSKK